MDYLPFFFGALLVYHLRTARLRFLWHKRTSDTRYLGCWMSWANGALAFLVHLIGVLGWSEHVLFFSISFAVLRLYKSSMRHAHAHALIWQMWIG